MKEQSLPRFLYHCILFLALLGLILYCTVVLVEYFIFIHQQKLFSWILSFVGLLINIFAIWMIQREWGKKGWKEVKSFKTIYTTEISKVNEKTPSKKVGTINFSAMYSIGGKNYTKKFYVVKKLIDSEKIEKFLTEKEKEGKLNVILYYDSKNARKTVFQRGITDRGLVLTLLFIYCECIWNNLIVYIMTIGGEIEQIGTPQQIGEIIGVADQVTKELLKNSIGNLVLCNILLVMIYSLIMILAIAAMGIKRYRTYPKFYDKVNERTIDLLPELNEKLVTFVYD